MSLERGPFSLPLVRIREPPPQRLFIRSKVHLFGLLIILRICEGRIGFRMKDEWNAEAWLGPG